MIESVLANLGTRGIMGCQAREVRGGAPANASRGRLGRRNQIDLLVSTQSFRSGRDRLVLHPWDRAARPYQRLSSGLLSKSRKKPHQPCSGRQGSVPTTFQSERPTDRSSSWSST